MKNGHMRPLPAAFQAALAFVGVSEWRDVENGRVVRGNPCGGKMEDLREGRAC